MRNNTTGPCEKKKKRIISQLLKRGITKLEHTLSASSSLGYYPDFYKLGTIQLIIKNNKSPLDPIQ